MDYQKFEFDVRRVCYIRDREDLFPSGFLSSHNLSSILAASVVDGPTTQHDLICYKDLLLTKKQSEVVSSFKSVKNIHISPIHFHDLLLNLVGSPTVCTVATISRIHPTLNERLSGDYKSVLGDPESFVSSSKEHHVYRYNTDLVYQSRDKGFLSLVDNLKVDTRYSPSHAGESCASICTHPGTGYSLLIETCRIPPIASVNYKVISDIVQKIESYLSRYKCENIVLESDLHFLPHYIGQSMRNELNISPILPQSHLGYHPIASLFAVLHSLVMNRYSCALLVHLKGMGELDFVLCSKES